MIRPGKITWIWTLIFCGIFAITGAQENLQAEEIIWHVKAIHPKGNTMDVKAFNENGDRFDVKAIEDAEQSYIMEVRAFVNGRGFPVKVLVSEDENKPLAGIDEQGNTYVLRAITADGKYLPIKGVRKSGYIVHVKAVNEDGSFYGVKALSTSGKLRDIKGVKMYDKQLEVTLNGVPVHAHVVALPQIQ
jgi:hypothetical protein